MAELAPEFPRQAPNYAYGLDSAGEWRYFRVPTPGAMNGDSAIREAVADVRFNAERS